jgi:AcrR family transcriptional regulator
MARAATETTGSGRRRVTLTRDVILDAALSVGSREGGSGLTFSRLGKELGADPTAVYRHFRDKDELVVALTDRMVAESVAQVADVDPDVVGWREWMCLAVRSIRSVYLARPAIAVLAASRTAASHAETTSVEQMIRVLHRAGLPVLEAAETYRAVVDLALAFTQYHAAFNLLDPEVQAKDERAWTVTYATLPEERFPELHETAPRLAELMRDDDYVFDYTLNMFLDGVEVRIARHAATAGDGGKGLRGDRAE